MDLFEKKDAALKYAVKIGKKTTYIVVSRDGECLEVSNPNNYVSDFTVFYVKYIDGEYIISVYN